MRAQSSRFGHSVSGRARKITGVALVIVALTVSLAGCGSPKPRGNLSVFSVFPDLSGVVGGITTGPDGALWFTAGVGGAEPASSIRRITSSGQVTAYALPAPIAGAEAIATGSDGALWFTMNNDQIGRITTSGQIHEYPIGNNDGFPSDITSGPDGALWFTGGDASGKYIGRITTSGEIREFYLPQIYVGGYGAEAIINGPDGALWFTEPAINKVGRITTDGQVTEFPLPTDWYCESSGITVGPDGALWFANRGCNVVGRITTSGAVTVLRIPSQTDKTDAITTGRDGALWIMERGYLYESNVTGYKLLRMTTTGKASELSLPNGDPNRSDSLFTNTVNVVSLGPDGALWFTENQVSRLGRFAPNT